MRIGLISDIHGNLPAFQAVMSSLHNRVELVLFLGDLAGYYPFVNECVAIWDANKIVGVRGNHDEELLRCVREGKPPDDTYRRRYGSALERSWKSLSEEGSKLLQSFPAQHHLTISSVSVSMFHGAPWNLLKGRVYPDFADWEQFACCSSDVILLGHTHYSMLKHWKNKLIVNPGSVGQPRDRSGGASYAEIDLATGEIVHRRAPYDPSPVIEASVRFDPDNSYLTEVLTR